MLLKMIKIPINLSFVIVFHVKILQKTINLLFCVVFASIKLMQYNIPEINYRLNDTIFFCNRVVSFVKKSVITEP